MGFCSNFKSGVTRKKVLELNKVKDTELKRCLSVIDLSLIGIGATLGAGIYVLSGQVAKNLAGPGIVLSFLVAAVASLLSGLCYAEFGSRIPKAGSAYLYCYVSIGELCAFIIGWNLLLEYIIGVASTARGLSGYIDNLLEHTIQKHTQGFTGDMHIPGLSTYFDVLSFFLVIVLTVFISMGMRSTALVNNVFVVVNIITIFIIVIVGFVHADVKNWSNFLPYGPSGVISGAATCFFAFVGFDVIATASEEAQKPERNIPISILVTVGVCFVAYFGVSGAITLMVPYNELDVNSAVSSAFLMRGLKPYAMVVGFGVCTSLLGCTLVGMLPPPRIVYAMAQDGMLPAKLAQVNKVTSVPVIATIISGFTTAVLAMILDLESLVEMLSIGTLLAYSIVVVSVLVIRYRPEPIGSPSKGKFKEKVDDDFDPARSTSRTSIRSWYHRRDSATVIYMTILTIILELIAICVISRTLLHNKHPATVPVLCTLAVIVAALLITVFFLSLEEQNPVETGFKSPLVPWLPALALFFNIYLMIELSKLTWIRFAIWLALGLLIYISYSFWHSKEREGNKPSTEEELGLLNTTHDESDNEEKPAYETNHVKDKETNKID